MATGAMSSLGLGSQGALSYDVIDKLKAADKSSLVDPITRNITSIKEKEKNLSIISSLAANLKGAASSLSDSTLYQKRDSSVSGDSVTATADAGVKIQEINIDVTSLATRDMHESKGFTSINSTFTNSQNTITFTIDSQDYEIEIDGSTTITELADKINAATDGKIEANIMNVGGDDPYKLIIKSAETGEANDIQMSSTGSALKDLKFSEIGDGAQDASFTYNGINIKRASNTVDDLVVGLTLNLEETGKSTIKISQNKESIVDEIRGFVQNYNEVISNLNESTKYDEENKTAGVFQGVSEITSVKRMINKTLLSVTSEGKSITDFGISLNQDGILQFNASEFEEKFAEDPTLVEKVFKGNITFQPISITSDNVQSGSINAQSGDLVINGENITFSTNGTASENAQALLDAINDTNINDLKVSLDSSGEKVVLYKKSGGEVDITGNESILEQLGLKDKSSTGKSTTEDGIFAKLNTELKNTISGSNASLNLYETSLGNQKKSLSKEELKAKETLDQRYQIMAERFAAYDGMIGKLNAQFQSLQMMINAEINSKS